MLAFLSKTLVFIYLNTFRIHELPVLVPTVLVEFVTAAPIMIRKSMLINTGAWAGEVWR